MLKNYIILTEFLILKEFVGHQTRTVSNIVRNSNESSRMLQKMLVVILIILVINN